MEIKMAFGYRGKLILAISMVNIMMLAILVASCMFFIKDILQDRAIIKVESIGNIILYEMQQKLLKNDLEGLEKTAKITAAQKHIKFVSLIDKNNKVIFSSENLEKGKDNKYKDSIDIKKEKDVYIKSFDIENEQGNVGHIQIGFLLKTIEDDLKKLIFRSILIIVIPLFLIIYISWIVSGQLLKPLYKMKFFTEEISKGNFSERIAVSSRDIIGELAISLNDMAKQLGDLTNNLNIKIQEATRQLIDRQKELEMSNKQLKELDKLKSEFVSIVSHELRTPLTSIIGFTKTLLKVKVTDEQNKKYLEIIESEGKRLTKLIEEFLDISRIESGNMEIQKEIFDLKDLISEIILEINLKDSKKINFFDASENSLVNADKNKIKQVITNILDNAFRYTNDDGKIVVSIYNEQKFVTVSIKDEGIGIKLEEQSKIFDKFYRVRDGNTNRGSGLGLAIAKGIIDMHKGQIRVESKINEGSNFKFSLPN
jgi:signal transduction histidine kinase